MLSIHNITFGYEKRKPVLHNLSLEFSESGVYGLLGKNGTGKSTLLSLTMGLLRPWKGHICWQGEDTSLRRPETLADIFIVPEEYDLPHIGLNDYIRALAPMYPRFSKEVLDRCLDGFEMPREVALGSLSMGQKKKVYMCMALATGCRLLLLDEPTNGLDIPSKSLFRKVIAGNLGEDQTIIISTHQVRDVERLLDHVTMIDQNRVVVNDRMSNLFGDDESIDLERLFLARMNP